MGMTLCWRRILVTGIDVGVSRELCERQLGGERQIENQKTKETSIPKQMN